MEGEIDLFELFLKFITLIRNKIKIILLAILIGGVIGSITFYIYPDVFLYEISGFSPIIDNQVISKSISEFSSELKNKNLYEFCESNNLDIKTFEKVKSINTNILKNDPESNIEISVLTKTPININDVSIELENYISKNKYISKKISLRENQLKSTISFLNKQINKIENKDSNNYNELEIISKEESAASLYIDKNKYEEELAFLKPIIITSASSNPKISKPGLIVYIICGSFIATLLIFIYFFFQKVNKIIKKEQAKNSSVSFYRETA